MTIDALREETTEATATSTLSDADRADRLNALNALIGMMAPSVWADGGDLTLVSADVETGVVEVALSGACGSCAISSSTLQGGVDRILRDRLEWVTEVRGSVEEDDDAVGYGAYVPKYASH